MSVEAVLLHHADWKDFKAVILTPPSALDMMPVSILQKRWEMIRCLLLQHMQSYPHCRLYDKPKIKTIFSNVLDSFPFACYIPCLIFQQVEVTANHFTNLILSYLHLC